MGEINSAIISLFQANSCPTHHIVGSRKSSLQNMYFSWINVTRWKLGDKIFYSFVEVLSILLIKVSLTQFDVFTEGLKHRKFPIFKKCHLRKLQHVRNTFFTLFENQHEILCSDTICFSRAYSKVERLLLICGAILQLCVSHAFHLKDSHKPLPSHDLDELVWCKLRKLVPNFYMVFQTAFWFEVV